MLRLSSVSQIINIISPFALSAIVSTLTPLGIIYPLEKETDQRRHAETTQISILHDKSIDGAINKH